MSKGVLRFGERAMYWTGPRAEDAPRLVTESAYRFLTQRDLPRAWRDRSTQTSPTVPTVPDPTVARLSTGMTARDLVRPLPGLQQIINSLLHQPRLFKMVGQLHRHFVCLRAIQRLLHIAHRLVQIGPLHVVQTKVQVLLEEMVSKAVEGKSLPSQPFQ